MKSLQGGLGGASVELPHAMLLTLGLETHGLQVRLGSHASQRPLVVVGVAQQDELHVIQIDVVQQRLEHLLHMRHTRVTMHCRGRYTAG
eukprot:9501473-Pyramimonas_sp.AAC.1